MSSAVAELPSTAIAAETSKTALQQGVAALGGSPLSELLVRRHIAPHFSRVLGRDRIYLANHSLGRAPDQLAGDLAEATAAWNDHLGDAWGPWLDEREAYRARLAELIHAPRPDCVVPRTSAAQGLRAVLNVLPIGAEVVATRGEFDSVDLVLKQYAAHGRITMRWVDAPAAAGDGTPEFTVGPLIAAIRSGTALVVASQIFFSTGQILGEIPALAAAAHAAGALLLLDAYHAVGVVPVDVQALGADALIGASYKYLRGGPGAGFFYLSPSFLERFRSPLDCGWFAKADFFDFGRQEVPSLAPGGDAWLEATPPIYTWYQARAGQQFVLAVGVERLREFSLRQLGIFKGLLAESGIEAHGGDGKHGAFLVVRNENAVAWSKALAAQGIDTDARGPSLRLCPDCLTSEGEMQKAAEILGKIADR